MSYAPASITALARYWTSQGGVNLGIVGDLAHANRASYHNGRDRIVAAGRLYTDYTCQNVRDRSGLTNAASALDLGRLEGSYQRLRMFSVWLVAQCRANRPGTSDIRDVIYTADGTTVLRWDRERGVKSAPRAGEADTSHRWHTHISFYRDSERRAKIGLFSPFFVVPPDTSTEDDVRVVTVTLRRWPQPKQFRAKVAELRRFTATEELDPIPGFYSGWVGGTAEIQGNEGAPHGVGFYELSSGGSAGKYILQSEVEFI